MTAKSNLPQCDCGLPRLNGTEHADECPAGIVARNPILRPAVVTYNEAAVERAAKALCDPAAWEGLTLMEQGQWLTMARSALRAAERRP